MLTTSPVAQPATRKTQATNLSDARTSLHPTVVTQGQDTGTDTGVTSSLVAQTTSAALTVDPAPSTPPQTVNGVTTWTVDATDASVVAITGTGKDIVDIAWGDSTWFTVTKEANGSLDFDDIHATSHQVIVSGVADVFIGDEEYNVATGTWSVVPPSGQTTSSSPPSGSAPSTPPQTVNGVTTWTVDATDASVVAITGTGKDVVDIAWGDSSWFTVTKEANGSLDFDDIHATSHQVIVSGVADVVIGDEEYNVATGAWSIVPPSGQTTSSSPPTGSAPSTPPQTVNGVTTWTVDATDASVVSITGTGKDIVDIAWGDSTWFTVTKEANGSLDFDDIHATSHQVIVSGVADVVIGDQEYNVAAGTWGTVTTSGQTTTTSSSSSSSSSSSPSTGSAPSTPPQTVNGVTTWTVESTDASVVSITGTGEDVVDIAWGDSSWFTVTKEANGSLDFDDIHATSHQVVVSNVADVVIGGEEYNVATGTWTAVSAPGAPTTIDTPSVTQASGASQVVGLTLQNPGTTAIAARYITFGEQFSEGQVPAGGSLVVVINGQTFAVQMDIKTTYADGSVQSAVLTMQQPALAAGESLDAMLALGTASTASAVNISTLTDANYNVNVALTLHNANGSTTALSYDAAALLQAALKAGTVSYWLKGPQATEVTFNVATQSSMYLTFDVTLYADGTTHTDVEFNNDIAMGASGGTMTYDVTISQNKTTVLQQNNVTQYQYQTWQEDVWSNGAPEVNLIHNVSALEASGLIQNYDTTVGVSSATLDAELSQLGGSTYGILGSGSITQYMPTTGDRADIGPMPEWSVVALLTQDAGAQEYAEAQANAAGSIPWHFFDATTGQFISIENYPDLWTDSRAGSPYGGTALAQPVSTDTGWTTDFAHAPDVAYLQYLETGSTYYLEQLNAEAAAVPLAMLPSARDDANGNISTSGNQVRGIAWGLRTLVEAAVANPDGSAEKAYFTQLVDNNLNDLLAYTQTAQEGQLSGWFSGGTGGLTLLEPWEQNYLVTSLAFAAENGFSGATQILQWETNFIAGQFLNGANGFSPWDGADYNLIVADSTTGALYQTWSQVSQASAAAGDTNTTPNTWLPGDFYALARAALADIITTTGSTEAIQAFGWLSANTGQVDLQSYFANDPTYDIAPRLNDGNLLTLNNIFIYDDATTTKITAPGGNADQLVYETGAGNVTIQGGNGINILFGGSGLTTLNGGSGNDYLFAGTGSTSIYGGAGDNFMQSGTPTAYTAGATTFMLNPADLAQDTISGFRIGTDHLQIVGDAPGSAALAQLIKGSIANAAGDAVLQLSSTHDVTLTGIATSQLSQNMFA